MLTTPEQRAQWAKLDKERPGAWRDLAYRSAVPSLLADVEELEGKLAESVDYNRRFYDKLTGDMDAGATLRAQVERLTALLRELRNLPGLESGVRCRIERELEGK